MHEHVTLLPPETRREEGGLSSPLPPDLLEQVRGRVRLLTMLILIAFAFDPVLYFLAWSVATVAGVPLTAAVVILFPLILPGPPRRMLAAAILAAAMPPLALLLLELSGKVAADSGDYVDLSSAALSRWPLPIWVPG